MKKKLKMFAVPLLVMAGIIFAGCSIDEAENKNEDSNNTTKITLKLYANGGKYNGNSSSGVLADATATVNENEDYSMSSTSAKFTYTGYTLLGWSQTKKTPSSSLTTSDCEVTASGSTKFKSTNGTTIYLYAVWKTDTNSSEGTLVDNETSIPTNSYIYTKFTLNKIATVTVSMSCDGELDYYFVDSDNFDLFENGSAFKYYSAVSADDAESVSGSVRLAAGTYYYVIKNENLLATKTVTRKITYK